MWLKTMSVLRKFKNEKKGRKESTYTAQLMAACTGPRRSGKRVHDESKRLQLVVTKGRGKERKKEL